MNTQQGRSKGANTRMTTFKNNAKYAELPLHYLDYANCSSSPLTVEEVLSTFRWRFKGGSLQEAAAATRLAPRTSKTEYPEGTTEEILKEWPRGDQARALKRILGVRARTMNMKTRSREATLGTWMMLTSKFGTPDLKISIHSGMTAIYWAFSQIWSWARKARPDPEWTTMQIYTRELALGAAAASHLHVPTAEGTCAKYWGALEDTRVPALLSAVFCLKLLVKSMAGKDQMALARKVGAEEMSRWEDLEAIGEVKGVELSDMAEEVRWHTQEVGPLVALVGQRCCLLNRGQHRMALSMSDAERLHQLVMSATSCLVGCAAQASTGTAKQRLMATRVLQVAEDNIQRIVDSSAKVPLGDEVLVCKGYRKAYTAHMGRLAGSLCSEETAALEQEARETAPPGVIDVDGFLESLRGLDAAGALNAAKVFKMCPAPDVSPGGAMIDRIKTSGNGNIFDPEMAEAFEVELRDQILRAYIRSPGTVLRFRTGVDRPSWHGAYMGRNFDQVPTAEIHTHLAWEGTAEMPKVSPHDPANWKDSGLGADSIRESERHHSLGRKRNMITRLLFDSECPMPGRVELNPEHVIKFFVKAEGHKDPARGIFSANLTDRFAQSWMERGVERVARHHPSFMLGATAEVKELKVKELTSPPTARDHIALYYSFDISGWSAKMPAEPQRISHNIWATLYGGHLYTRATEINEGAHIYLALEGYDGWFQNTAANLEGFNGKEMTMILVALLSLSVRVWRLRVVEAGVLTKTEAEGVVALLLAYIDDGLCRIDLPRAKALDAFQIYKTSVIDTFARCGFSVETTKCFPSDRFAIFLNEIYIAGRHVVHGVRAAMGISAEPTERHHSLIEHVTSVSTGCRGAVMAGLSGFGGTLLMAFHVYLHLREWVSTRDPAMMALWSYVPRAWGGLGLPTTFQMTVSGSGSAFEEGVATLQKWAAYSRAARHAILTLARAPMQARNAISVMTAPLSARIVSGYMVDSRVAGMVRDALKRASEEGRVSPYADRLLRYADMEGFKEFAEAVVPLGQLEVVQEQMLDNIHDAHPHSIFSAFAARVEKSSTVAGIVGGRLIPQLIAENRREARESLEIFAARMGHLID